MPVHLSIAPRFGMPPTEATDSYKPKEKGAIQTRVAKMTEVRSEPNDGIKAIEHMSEKRNELSLDRHFQGQHVVGSLLRIAEGG